MPVRIDQLPSKTLAEASDVVPAMRAGETFKLSIEQVKTLIVSAIVDSAPATLDTLNELAAALGDDPNFATTVANALAKKASLDGVETLTNKTLSAPILQGAVSAEFMRGYKRGLTLSNNTTDSVNDIDIEAGSVGSAQSVPTLMTIPNSLTKRLDANWSPGSGNGMRYSGAAIANGSYHLYLASTASGTADVYADPSADAAIALSHLQAEPGGGAYVNMRRIGSIIRSGGSILGFNQVGNVFRLTNQAIDRSSASPVADALQTLTVPTGIRVSPLLSVAIAATATSNSLILLGGGDQSAAIQRVCQATVGSVNAVGSITKLYSNLAAQIRFTLQIESGSIAGSTLITFGWIDDLF